MRRMIALAYAHISIHAPPRGATLSTVSVTAHAPFQFTPLREGRRYSAIVTLPPTLFQFTPLREGRPAMLWCRSGWRIFQFTPLREGRRCSRSARRVRPFYFNSRPSARGDGGCTRNHLFQGISIHAPPRGATKIVETDCMLPIISIHAPPRGATFFAGKTGCERWEFQFTPLREGRPEISPVSSHHPHFNSRPSARGDHCVSPFLTQPAYFNSRPSARGDAL